VTSGVPETQAESAVMAKTAGKFETVNASLQSMLNTLMSELSVLQTAWVGQGARAFEQVRAQYERDLSSLNKALLETAAAVRSSGVNYDVTDTGAADRLSKSGGSYTLPL
jgi:WXG100 family type VII secretion target